MQRAPWYDTLPTAPAPLTPEQQARLHRYYSSECTDDEGVARDYEAEAGRDPNGPRWGLLLLACSIVCSAWLLSIVLPALAAWIGGLL